MKRQLSLFLIAVIFISLTLPFSSLSRGGLSGGEDTSEEKFTGFENVTIKTNPAVEPYGEVQQPPSDENVNVTVETDIEMNEAYLNVSAREWDGEPVEGFEPSDPGIWTFDISGDGYSATSLLNNIKYFPPGTDVEWKVELVNWAEDATYTSDTFEYEVKGAWPYNHSEAEESPDFENAFDANIDWDLSPELPPNAWDPVTITLQSRYEDVEIGQAILELEYENETMQEDGSLPSRTVDPTEGIEQVTIPGLPENTHVEFNLTAWDDQDDDRRAIRSADFNYTVAGGNTWRSDDFAENIDLSTTPDVTGEDAEVNMGEPVNITIKSENSDVPIETAVFEYEIGGTGVETQEGQDIFNEIMSTEWYYEMPGMPPGIEIDFRVRAYDIMRREIVSQSYSYIVEEEEVEAPDEMTFFYVTVFDGEKNEYVGGAHITIQNETWIWEGKTNPSGFAYPTKMNSPEPIFLHYGEYDITVEYDGMTKNRTFELSPQSDDTIEFEFNPTEDREDPVYAAPVENPPYYLIGLAITSGLAGVVGYLVYRFRKDVNKKSGLAEGG